ncbi:universal stress protein [Halobacterium litoreum]|uniref:Universal stress protein n=1 Tax=Halobacterium litoreum TaxID=2039234 RepID=A0ABD5N8I6_9EURY|nr:universal stress protein [Halobacterium litoreum]UHH12092.1 universal stress protein [Halobacterium litoreum]
MRVLVPVRVLRGESVPPGVAELLAPTDVVVLGYHVLPEQTPPEQGRDQFEERATAALEDAADAFREAGASVETVLAFTNDGDATVDRTAAERDADAVVHLNPATDADDLLVPLVAGTDLDRLSGVVAALAADRDVSVTTLTAPETPGDVPSASDAAGAIRDAGVPAGRITTLERETGGVVDAVADIGREYDAVVVSEPTPTLREFLFGELEDRIAAEGLGPVVVVRSPSDESGDDAPDEGA